MERSLTVDLPVEEVAKVVRRHLVFPAGSFDSLPQIPHHRRSHPKRSRDAGRAPQQSPTQQHSQQQEPPMAPTIERTQTSSSSSSGPIYSTHHLLPGGAIVDEIYKWTARVENQQRRRRQRAESISLPATRRSPTDRLLQSLKQPGGFRRHYVLANAARQGKAAPNFITSSFVDFLCLYGHFGGEDLSDKEDEDEDDDSDDGSISSDYSSSSSEEDSDEDTVGNIMAYRGNMLHPASYQSTPSSDARTGGASELPLPVTTPSSSSRSHYPPQHPLAYNRLNGREGMPLLPNRPSRRMPPKATPGKAMFLLLKSFVTTGIMFLPKAFYNGGLLFATFGVAAWGLISFWSFLLLVQTRLVVHSSFADMGGVLYGPKMKKAVLMAITLSQIGFVCAYMVFVAENIQALVLTFSKCRVLLPMHLLILAQSFAFIPLAMIRKIQRLSVFALIGDVFIVIGLGYLFYYDIKELVVVGVGDIVLWNPLHFPLFIGTVAFTYEGIGLVIPITESMKEPEKFPSVLKGAITVITGLFITLGAVSYMAFGKDVQTIILLNLPSKDPVVSSIQTLYSLAICLSIPLQLFPVIRIMENGLFTTRSGKNNAIVKWQKNVFRVLVVFFCAWIAIVGSLDKLDKFVSLVGALFCIPLCFIFPPLFHLKALPLPPLRRAADVILITFGVLSSISVAAITVMQWNSSDKLDPVQQCIAHHS